MNLLSPLYRNQLEPSVLLSGFVQYPPPGFSPQLADHGPIAFTTCLDLLTTAAPALRARLRRWPGYGCWQRLLWLETCFIGATTSEYACLPQQAEPAELLDWIAEHGSRQPLIIIKDLPCASPLLTPEENDYSDRLSALAQQRGFISVAGQALAWVAIDFPSIDHYLSRLSHSRRRHIRRKLRSRHQLHVERLPCGDARFNDAGWLAQLYQCYLAVWQQSEIHFDRLSLAFFSHLLQDAQSDGMVFCYSAGARQQRSAEEGRTVTARLPLILDFDGSVRGIARATVLPLQPWQEAIRFGCRWRDFQRLASRLTEQLPANYGCVLTGSGDYHHLSYLLLQRVTQPLQLIVCDNHPDTMRYPLGIHCGSWVWWASRLPQVSAIHVLGICSHDISWRHRWEIHAGPQLRRKLTYWSLDVSSRWLNWPGRRPDPHCFHDPDTLMAQFLSQLAPLPVYLSLDKDVLSPQVVTTNWDQGRLLPQHLIGLIRACRGRLLGADITGEASAYRFQRRFKRWLCALDGQPLADPAQLAAWQWQHRQLNRLLLAEITPALAAPGAAR